MGEQFARARKAQQLTQAELAKRAGVRLRSLQEWEQGTRIPRFDRVVQLADALAITLDELAGRTPPPGPQGAEPSGEKKGSRKRKEK
jgi:transcriptional regulator with XRE-family HTH domain